MSALIKQRTPHDCVICSLAMLTGRSYEDVVAAIGDVFDPERGVRYEQKALERLGFSCRFENGEPAGDFVSLHRAYAFSPQFFRSLAWGRRALVSVPSLNYPDGSHMIYWDGIAVLDPSDKKTYQRFDELLPEELVLFRETRP